MKTKYLILGILFLLPFRTYLTVSNDDFYKSGKIFPSLYNTNAEIINQGCKDLPGGDWHLFIGNRQGNINFHSGNFEVWGGDGAPGYKALVQNCTFNPNTMEVSWASEVVVARGAKPQIYSFTGVYDVKQNKISGTWSTSAIRGSKYKWAAEAPKGSVYNDPTTTGKKLGNNNQIPSKDINKVGSIKGTTSGGYWRRTGKVEYDTGSGRLPTQGVIEGKIDNAWSYKAEATESTFQHTGILRIGNKVQTIILRGSWFARPSVIIPGVVIPCGGRAELVDIKLLPGGPGGRCDVLCRLMNKRILNGKASFGLLTELITGNEIVAIGYGPVSSQAQNTKRVYGNKDQKTIYLSYHISCGPGAPAPYQVFYEYEWVDGPMSAELEATVRQENEKVFGSIEAGLAGGSKSTSIVIETPPVLTAPPVSNLSGTWNLYSGGQVGTNKEKVISYTGTIFFADAASYLSFGTKEPLKDYVFKDNSVSFLRPLTGVIQKYQGILITDSKIEGTFDHNGTLYYWRAESKNKNNY